MLLNINIRTVLIIVKITVINTVLNLIHVSRISTLVMNLNLKNLILAMALNLTIALL